MQLFLEDLSGYTEQDVRNHIICDYTTTEQELNQYDILIAYESVGSWGCDSTSWFLFKHKETGELYENYGSHCSCHGFENQFSPEKTTLEYLKSDNFYFSTGGYDSNSTNNRKKVDEFIAGIE